MRSKLFVACLAVAGLVALSACSCKKKECAPTPEPKVKVESMVKETYTK